MSATNAKAVTENAARKGKPKSGADTQFRVITAMDVVTDPSRDALLTDFGKKTLEDRYLLPGESYQD
ncbi:MAG TPA: ribonucleotide-diphosphate reductase subunit alpha, partial [Hyphomonas sp.]|nr:ribonucleotide-diphosphate reductase subunit alpha [Hyphomonas sp.]